MTDDGLPEKLRLFVAISIPEPVRAEMLRVQRELQPLAPPDSMRWTRPDQLHLTLRFLGEVPVQSVAALKHALAETCAGFRPFRLSAKGIGFFPDVHAPRVIWVGIEDSEQVLADLQAAVERALSPFAENPVRERFRAHTTLGRFQKYRRYKTEQLVRRARSYESHGFGDWPVENMGLFRSELSPEGARHTALAVFRLGAV